MKYFLKKVTKISVITKVLSIVLMLAFLASINAIFGYIGNAKVYALEYGAYIASAEGHYRSPIDNTISDAGGVNGEAIAMGMIPNVVNSKALIEIDESGNTFATVRFYLMDFINNVKFQTADSGSATFSDVKASIIQENKTDYYTDFQFKIKDINTVIKSHMFVTAMGRDVVFFITLSSPEKGSGDFKTTINTSTQQATAQTKVKTSAQATSVKPKSTAPSESSTAATSSSTTSTSAVSSSEAKKATTIDTIIYSDEMPSVGKGSEFGAVGVLEYDENGKQVTRVEENNDSLNNPNTTDYSKLFIALTIAGLIIVAVFIVLAARRGK